MLNVRVVQLFKGLYKIYKFALRFIVGEDVHMIDGEARLKVRDLPHRSLRSLCICTLCCICDPCSKRSSHRAHVTTPRSVTRFQAIKCICVPNRTTLRASRTAREPSNALCSKLPKTSKRQLDADTHSALITRFRNCGARPPLRV